MDISTGKTYQTKAEALLAGVAESDLAELIQGARGEIEPKFAPGEFRGTGPFSNRIYRRTSAGNSVLVRTE